jgi:hypothetical protein
MIISLYIPYLFLYHLSCTSPSSISFTFTSSFYNFTLSQFLVVFQLALGRPEKGRVLSCMSKLPFFPLGLAEVCHPSSIGSLALFLFSPPSRLVQAMFYIVRPVLISQPDFSLVTTHCPDDGGSTHPWTADLILQDCMAPYPRRLSFHTHCCEKMKSYRVQYWLSRWQNMFILRDSCDLERGCFSPYNLCIEARFIWTIIVESDIIAVYKAMCALATLVVEVFSCLGGGRSFIW